MTATDSTYTVLKERTKEKIKGIFGKHFYGHCPFNQVEIWGFNQKATIFFLDQSKPHLAWAQILKIYIQQTAPFREVAPVEVTNPGDPE